ncbi:1189_t:CDS:1, partial [Acaulospora morrowiae]
MLLPYVTSSCSVVVLSFMHRYWAALLVLVAPSLGRIALLKLPR